ncbi:NAD-dependent epimerase/dehydratase family protein [Chitinophagaceae bacterium MMS25-I14]
MILVTGASGFVGQHLVRFLSARGAAVRALYRNTAPDAALLALPGVQWMKCDLLDIFDVEEAMQGIEDVYHCAAIVSFHPSHQKDMLHANVLSTAHVVDEALAQGVRKLAYVSSVAALGRTEGAKEITEAEEWEESRYNSAYGLSKYQAEMEVWRGIAEGLNAVIVNPGIILGEGSWEDGSSRLIKVAAEEFPFYTEGINGWVDVADVVHALYVLMQSEVDAERFILSAGNFSYREIFTMMAEALHKKPPHIKATPFMTGLIWRWNHLRTFLTGKITSVTRETARNAQKQSFYNNGKLLRYLPQFSYTPLSQTIRRMAGAYIKDTEI